VVFSCDGVALLTQSANLWHHVAWPLDKAGHGGAGKALHLPVAAARLGALWGCGSPGRCWAYSSLVVQVLRSSTQNFYRSS